MSISISEVTKQKEEMEDEIADTLRGFHKRTGVPLDEIVIEHEWVSDPISDRTVKDVLQYYVTIKVVL
jgi:hypothetical protein